MASPGSSFYTIVKASTSRGMYIPVQRFMTNLHAPLKIWCSAAAHERKGGG